MTYIHVHQPYILNDVRLSTTRTRATLFNDSVKVKHTRWGNSCEWEVVECPTADVNCFESVKFNSSIIPRSRNFLHWQEEYTYSIKLLRMRQQRYAPKIENPHFPSSFFRTGDYRYDGDFRSNMPSYRLRRLLKVALKRAVCVWGWI